MAKLSTSYPLCPLIGQENFLGIANDSVQDCIIVTLGKNIVIRYKLEGQKQVRSWSNKDKLSAAVVYDNASEKYVGVFNQNQIRIWSENEELDKVKKYKFGEQIFTLLTSKELKKTYVIYQKGIILALTEAIENRKQTELANIFKPNEILESCTLCSHNDNYYVAYFSKIGQDKNFTLVSLSDNKVIKSISCKNKLNPLNNWCVMTIENKIILMSIWTDGNLYSLNLFTKFYHSEFPGDFLHKIEAINFHKSVALLPLGQSHLVIYGSDSCEEGATMLVYSLKFHLVQARHHFKFFASPPFLAKSNNNILLNVGDNLGVVPFELNEALLSSVIGSRISDSTESEFSSEKVVLKDWLQEDLDFNIQVEETSGQPDNIRKLMPDFLKNGLSQVRIFEEMIERLIKLKDIPAIVWCLDNFEDISENKIASLLTFSLAADESLFDYLKNGKECESISDLEEEDIEKDAKGFTSPMMPFGRRVLIDHILAVNVNDIQMIPHLKNISLEHTLMLLEHLGSILIKFQERSKIPLQTALSWMSMILDAHYQDFILSQDPRVKELLLWIGEIIEEKIMFVRELNILFPYLQKLTEKKPFNQNKKIDNKWYSIEKIKLY